MKKTILIASALLLVAIVFNNCKKENNTLPKTPQIIEETVETTVNQATFSWKVDYTEAVCSFVEISLNNDMSYSTRYGTNELSENKTFTVTATGLKGGTTYYYRYLVWTTDADYVKDIKNFTTKTDVPIVKTLEPTEITRTSAVLNGEIVDECGYAISECGFCFNTSPNPSLSDSQTVTSSGTGAISLSIEHLTAGVTYYYRTYAKNSKGVAFGENVEFTTEVPIVPTVASIAVNDATVTTAVMSGNILDNGGIPIIDCGVCWSTEHNPTIDNGHNSFGPSSESFVAKAIRLDPNTQYYLRAYATNQTGTGYGEELTITTLPVALEGIIDKTFSVSEDSRIVFSKGNLQYRASTDTWRFAGNQYGTCGENNQYIASNYNDYIDLFGWGTSGYDHGAIYYHPWNSSFHDEHQLYYAYGSPEYNLGDQTGQADWGYNAISNGGNQENLWRTMTVDEWRYLVFERQTLSNIRFAKAIYNEVFVLIILPDNWQESVIALNNANDPGSNFNSNNLTADQYQKMCAAGAVFLPTAGWRWGQYLMDYYIGSYNTATSNNDYVYSFSFGDGSCYIGETASRYMGASVRLVHDIQ